MEFIKELFKGSDGYVEIREIGADFEKAKQHFFTKQNIESYTPAPHLNIYFGAYSRNKKSGKAGACEDTRAIWVDYDEGMTGLTITERSEKVKRKIAEANIPGASILVNSGNGIHAYWLLNKRAGAEVVEINKAIALATNGDIKATDKARILRLPNTLNVKDINNPLKCEIIEADYSKTFDLSDIARQLGINIRQGEEKPSQGEIEPCNDILNEINTDRPCISAILKGVQAGERNFALGRLTKWLQVKGYTKEKAKKIITEWNKRNNPPEEQTKLLNDFNGYWKGDYKLLGCGQNNPALQQLLYKYCDRSECNFNLSIGEIKFENSIPYNNRLLNDLRDLTGNDIIIYGLLVRHKEGLTTSQLIKKLTARGTNKACVSKMTRTKSLETLQKKSFIEVIKGNRRKGIEDLQKAKPQGNFGLGYTLASNGAINGAIDKRVTAGELRLYILLLKYAYGKGNCFPSLETLAKDLRVTPSNISHMLNRLEKADYIKRNYGHFEGIEKLYLILLV